MTAFALTDTGVTVQTLDEIKSELEASYRGADGIHPNLDVSTTSPFGRHIAITAERERNIQLLARDVYTSFNPRDATGDALAQRALLTGTVKDGAGTSVVTASVTLTAGTTLSAGSRANVDGDDAAIFESRADVTNSLGITASVDVLMYAVIPGAVRAPAGTLTVINTPSSGWLSVTNAFDAEVGTGIETDPALRLRREEELRSQGSAALQAVVADVFEVPGVLVVRGFENDTDVTDADGVTPHAIELVVWDGTSPLASDSAVAQAIFDGKAAGVGSVQSGLGTAASGTAVDDEGGTHVTLFTRALIKTLYLIYDLTTDASYPIDGDTQVKAAAVAAVNDNLSVGDDVIATKLFAAAYTVTGVVDVVSLKLGFSAAPAGTTNLTVGSREIAIADTGRVSIV